MKLKFIVDKKYDLKFARGKTAKRYLKNQYAATEPFLKFTAKEYQKSWNKINDEFSQYIEKETGSPWLHKKYFCLVSPTHQGISNWDGSDRIIRWWLENPFGARRMTAHELIIHHVFGVIQKKYSQKKISRTQIWALAEITAIALTSLTPQAKKFWPWDVSGYYTDHNYQSLVPLQKKMKEKFLKRKNFDDFIISGIKIIKKYKEPIGFY
jgi:hypothetical protein